MIYPAAKFGFRVEVQVGDPDLGPGFRPLRRYHRKKLSMRSETSSEGAVRNRAQVTIPVKLVGQKEPSQIIKENLKFLHSGLSLAYILLALPPLAV